MTLVWYHLVSMLGMLLRFGQGFKDWASRYLQGLLLAPSRAVALSESANTGFQRGPPGLKFRRAVLAWFSTGEISRFARTINRETILQDSLVLNSPDSATVQLQKQQLVAPFFDSCAQLNPSSSCYFSCPSIYPLTYLVTVAKKAVTVPGTRRVFSLPHFGRFLNFSPTSQASLYIRWLLESRLRRLVPETAPVPRRDPRSSSHRSHAKAQAQAVVHQRQFD